MTINQIALIAPYLLVFIILIALSAYSNNLIINCNNRNPCMIILQINHLKIR